MNQRDTKPLTVQAKTVDAALKEAASKFETTVDQLDYELVSKTDAGFLSFLGMKKVEIKAWPKSRPQNKERRGAHRAENNRQESRRRRHEREDEDTAAEVSAEPLSAQEQEQLIVDIKEFAGGICKYLTGTNPYIEHSITEDRLILNIESPDVAEQMQQNTRLAEALEHLLRKKPRYLKRELPFRIFVDAQGQRQRREQELIGIARDLSDKVTQNQRPIVLNYRSSYDRKIIHMALDRDENVYTKSVGSGPNRKLMILPVNGDRNAQPEHIDA